jgi:hypothetical protein
MKDESDHFEQKYAKLIQIFLSKRSYPDPVQLFRIRIRPGQKVPDPGLDPQICLAVCSSAQSQQTDSAVLTRIFLCLGHFYHQRLILMNSNARLEWPERDVRATQFKQPELRILPSFYLVMWNF